MRRFGWTTLLLSLLAATLVAATPAASPNWPAHISLPAGWLAEGIAIGKGHTFYAGNSATGAVYAGDLRTGEGAVLVDVTNPSRPGRRALGVFVDDLNRIWVAGGQTGKGWVYDGETGADIAEFTFTPPSAPGAATFINDVYVTGDAAYFTNTSQPFIYRVPIGPGGAIGSQADVESFNLGITGMNGIEATPDGKTLIIVSIAGADAGKLFAVDVASLDTGTPVKDQIEVTDASGNPVLLTGGDGLIIQGKTLYVVLNRLDGAVAVVKLAPDLSSGELVNMLDSVDEPMVNPATADRFGHSIYVIRRNDAPAGPNRVFWITKLEADKG